MKHCLSNLEPLLTTAFLGDLPSKLNPAWQVRPDWLPQISFTWFALIGSLTVFLVGVWFTTPPSVLASAKCRAEEAETGEDVLLALR